MDETCNKKICIDPVSFIELSIVYLNIAIDFQDKMVSGLQS